MSRRWWKELEGKNPRQKNLILFILFFVFFLSSFLNLNEFKSMKHTTTTAADVKVVVWFWPERADGVSPHVWNILQLKIQKN